jgi:hypothetical protein
MKPAAELRLHIGDGLGKVVEAMADRLVAMPHHFTHA